MEYCTIDEAKAAGATGDDQAITTAIRTASRVVDDYTRWAFGPRDVTIEIVCGTNGLGRFNRPVTAVTEGQLLPDHYWIAPAQLPGSYLVEVTLGEVDVPEGVKWATARLAGTYCPTPFTAQADAEGQAEGQPPASHPQDETDPSPPKFRGPGDRTTGDPVVDAWLEPYKANRVMIG
jgi:hypothetical protein